MQTDDLEAPSRGWQFRFSLFALFLVMTSVCVLFAWLAQPRKCRVEALFQVNSRAPGLLGEQPDLNADEIERFRQNQIHLAQSHFVIVAAIRDPRIAALPVLAGREDPVQWIADNLNVEFREGSELLVMQMRGPEGAGDDLRLIVDAVSRAYLDEVVLAEEQRRNVMRDALARSYARLHDELLTKTEEAQKELAEHGADDAELKIRKMDIEVLTEVLRKMGYKLEVYDVDALAPPRVRQIQTATIISD